MEPSCKGVSSLDATEWRINMKTINEKVFMNDLRNNEKEACTLLQSFSYYRKATKRLMQAQMSPDFDTVECGVSYFMLKEYKAEVILFGKISHLNTVSETKFLVNYVEYKELKDLIPDKVEDLSEAELAKVISQIRKNKELPRIRTTIQEVSDVFETIISNVSNM